MIQSVVSFESAVRFDGGLEQVSLVASVSLCLERADALALHDELGADVALGFQQNGIHVGGRLDAAGQRLQRRRAADLAAVRRDRGVVGHVLRLERPHAMAAIREQAAEAGHQHGFADVGPAALDH